MSAFKLKPLPLAISLGILLVYLLLPTRNYYWDGIGFAQAIEDAPGISPSLIHPNHLLYTASGYLDYRLVQALGIPARSLPVRSLTVLRVTNSLLSAAAAYLFFEILLALFASQYASAILTFALAFSATWWRFSTDANAYVPSVLLLLAAFRALLPGRPARPFLLAVAHTGAMLFHELAVLFYPAAVVGLLLQTALVPLRQRLRAVIGYTSTAFLLTAGAYYAGFRWVQGSGAAAAAQPSVSSFMTFMIWAASHSSESSFSWSLAGNTFLTLRSHLRLFLGGRPAMAFAFSPRFTFAMLAAMAVFLAALVRELIRSREQIKTCLHHSSGARQPFRASLSLAAVWAIPYLLFLFFWLPGNVFYRLFYLPALLLFAGVVFAGDKTPLSARPNTAFAATLLVAIMAAANLTFDIVPNSRAASNPPLEFAQRIEPVFSPGAVIFYSNFNTDDWTIRYFNPATSWKKWEPAEPSGAKPSRNDLSVLDAELERADGAIWLDTTALDHLVSLPDGREWLQAHAMDHGRLELVNSRARIVFQHIANPKSGQR